MPEWVKFLLVVAMLTWPAAMLIRYFIDRRHDRLRHSVKWQAATPKEQHLEYQLDLNGCDPQSPLVFQITIFEPGNDARFVGRAPAVMA